MNYTLHFQLLDEQGRDKENGAGTAVIEEEMLSLTVDSGAPFLFNLRDINEVNPFDYSVELILTSSDRLVLSRLGRLYDPFYKNLIANRNEVILKDLLMSETLRRGEYRAEVKGRHCDGGEAALGRCELRLYETALVILPECGELVRVPYSEITLINREDYNLLVNTEYNGGFQFSRMGRQFDPFLKELNAAMDALSIKIQELLKELMPAGNPLTIREAAGLLKEGKSAQKADLDAIDPELWPELEKRLESAGIKAEYDFLLPLSRPEKVSAGIKRGLMGDLGGEYIWFLMPIYSFGPGEGGNAIAVEAASGDSSGRATYFFRITERSVYRNLASPAELDLTADSFIKELNRAMILINFRREPIYITSEQLNEPRFDRYRYAVQKIPALQTLRYHFIGRVFHYSDQQWREDVLALLKFNVECDDDSLKWQKNNR